MFSANWGTPRYFSPLDQIKAVGHIGIIGAPKSSEISKIGFHQASAEGGQCLQLAAADERLVFRSSSDHGRGVW